jgi:hypothetical protein
MKELIEALQIFLKYRNETWPTHCEHDKRCDEIIESLQQPSRPTHFECEMVQLSSNESFGLDYGSSNLKPKTTTNPQGQVELVGKYLNQL